MHIHDNVIFGEDSPYGSTQSTYVRHMTNVIFTNRNDAENEMGTILCALWSEQRSANDWWRFENSIFQLVIPYRNAKEIVTSFAGCSLRYSALVGAVLTSRSI